MKTRRKAPESKQGGALVAAGAVAVPGCVGFHLREVYPGCAFASAAKQSHEGQPYALRQHPHGHIWHQEEEEIIRREE